MRTLSFLFVSVILAFGVHADDTLTPHLPTESFSRHDQLPKVEEAKKWKAWDWDTDSWSGFQGRPWIKSGAEGCRLVRHKRFVVNYDTSLLNPRWTAHIDTRESAVNSENRPNSLPEWARPSKFLPDPFLVKLFKWKSLPYVVHDDFSGSGYSRGHMTSNAEMKGFDQASQIESFLLSNIAPQLQSHNGGIWSKLEADCLEWAKVFGRVYVITGPVFDPDQPRQYTKGKGKNRIPIPDKFYKVLLAEKDGHLITAGFLIDHKDGLKKQDLFKYQVSVDQIEEASGINFLPALGEPNSIETTVDPVWKGGLN